MIEQYIEITGKLVSINISGRETAASHETVFVIAPDDPTQNEQALKIDPFGSPERYEAMLRVLCTALAPGVQISIKAERIATSVPIAFMIDVRIG
ncbi:MAG: hypothetical protein NT015_09005 [Alphaproteobacteria bacterium]|nr:hypothetical protein [Alphaproteobacteria bacterium]